MTIRQLVATTVLASACSSSASPRPGDPAPACRVAADGEHATALRGPITAPDPRTATTLVKKGYPLDAAGIGRALVADDDPTALLAALTAVSVQQCRALLPRVEALLGAPPPTAVDAAVTLAELGTPAQRTRALAALHTALDDASWPEVQITAAVYLGRAGDAASVPAIHAALRSTNEAVRLQAVVSIAGFEGFDGRDVGGRRFSRLGELDTVLADPTSSWMVRREAVYQVARLAASAERMALLTRVAEHDPDERVRRAASLRLGGRGS
jgi:HEAT repeat protein